MCQKKNHNARKFQFLKPIVLLLSNFSCIIDNCKNKSLEVHHADFDSSNNHITNLVAICKEHHKLIHKNKLVLVLVRSSSLNDIDNKIDNFLINQMPVKK